MMLTLRIFAGSVGATGAQNEISPQLAATPSEPRILVLLIGVTKYPSLTPRLQLRGPGNDVDLVNSILETAFPNQIAHRVILREQAEQALLPTYANILREFSQLELIAKPGDQVFILFAGHGSQQPDIDGDEEHDRLDEILLPRDIGVWERARNAVPNAITDDQIHEWLRRIRRKGAFIFFVADTCHSGSMARGDEAVPRTVLPEDLNVPAVVPEATNSLPEPQQALKTVAADLPGGLVSLYASRQNESTYETEIPGRGSPRHGRLTWALCESLSSFEGPLTYGDVARRISWQYEQHRWYESHPWIEGAELEREFLGLRSFHGRRPPLLRSGKSGGFTINAGKLHGIESGTVLAVLGPDRAIIGHVRVTISRGLGSDVEPVAYDTLPANRNLASNSECEVVYLDFGDQSLNLAVDVSRISGHQQQRVLEAVESELRSVVDQDRLAIKFADSMGDAEWIVIVSGDNSGLQIAHIQDVLRDSEGRSFQRPGSQWMAIAGDGADRRKHVARTLQKIISCTNLRRLARATGDTPAISASSPASKNKVSMQLSVERLEDPDSGRFVSVPESGAVMKDKDELRVRITNTSSVPVDITLLYLANDATISSFFPQPGGINEHNRLEPSQSRLVEDITIDDSTVGLEDLILIAVEAVGVLPVDFSFLDQEGIMQDAKTRGLQQSPLQRLLDSANRADGRTRGGGVELGNYAIRRFSWTVTK